jgi:hypothetical protein
MTPEITDGEGITWHHSRGPHRMRFRFPNLGQKRIVRFKPWHGATVVANSVIDLPGRGFSHAKPRLVIPSVSPATVSASRSSVRTELRHTRGGWFRPYSRLSWRRSIPIVRASASEAVPKLAPARPNTAPIPKSVSTFRREIAVVSLIVHLLG